MSISIPMSGMNNLVGSTGPLRSARRAPLVQYKSLQNWDKLFVICCLVAIFIDPLFFLLLYVKQDDKCIAIDWHRAIAFVAIRSVTDWMYLLNMLVKGRFADVAPKSRRTAQKYLKRWFSIDLFLLFPFPQIFVLYVIPKPLGSSGAEHGKNLVLMAILFQYIPRLFRFLLLLGKSPNGLIFESAWANFVVNIFTYISSAHVIGMSWYHFGLQRVQQCLLAACVDSGFGHTCLQYIECGDGNFLGLDPNWKNWTKNENATACFSEDSFPYGIYKAAVNLTPKAITTRYLYSLFWGLQKISTLARNQQPSYSDGEVLFIMIIIGVSLLLFAFLLGNIQNFLQSLGRRRLELSLRKREVEQWMKQRNIPKSLKKRMRAAEVCNWAATRGVNEGRLIENFPQDIQRDLRRHLFKSVKTVRFFALMDQDILDAIFERLKRRIYIEGSEILYPGGVVDNVIFIVCGKLESIGGDGTVTPLSDESVCGEELLTWFIEHASASKDGKKIKVTGQRLLSNRTVRCLTDVEAFSLRAADLEEITDLYPRIQGAIRYRSPYWRCIAAIRIQVAWKASKARKQL